MKPYCDICEFNDLRSMCGKCKFYSEFALRSTHPEYKLRKRARNLYDTLNIKDQLSYGEMDALLLAAEVLKFLDGPKEDG